MSSLIEQRTESSKALAALIAITAPPEADMSCYFHYFRAYPIEQCPRDTNQEVRMAAFDYLADKIDSILNKD